MKTFFNNWGLKFENSSQHKIVKAYMAAFCINLQVRKNLIEGKQITNDIFQANNKEVDDVSKRPTFFVEKPELTDKEGDPTINISTNNNIQSSMVVSNIKVLIGR